MPIERDRASVQSSEALIAADRRARGLDRQVAPRTPRERQASKPRPTIVIGPVERSLTRTMLHGESRWTAGHHAHTVRRERRTSASDVPMASDRRGGRSGWRNGPRQSATPRDITDPTARAALDNRVVREWSAASGSIRQTATRSGTTLWKP